jgi:hypothetical protein
MTRFTSRISVLFTIVLVTALPLRAKNDSPSRDWTACPAVVELDTTKTIYALGDVHGDYDRFVKLLTAQELMNGFPDRPDRAEWTGGKSILVMTGDLIDKWTQSVQVLQAVRALQKGAAAAGGQLIVSVGNHEAEFLDDPDNKKAKDFRKELEDLDIDPQSVADGTDKLGLGKFMLCLPFASRVNDWFFSHAGDTDGRTLEKLVTKIEKQFEEDGYEADILLGNDGLLQARMKPPWWEREDDSPEDSIARLRSYAEALGVRHIVFGHQPGGYEFNNGTERTKGTMFQNFNGLMFLIDVGMSRGVDYSKGSLLEIKGEGSQQTAKALYRDHKSKLLWSASARAVLIKAMQ